MNSEINSAVSVRIKKQNPVTVEIAKDGGENLPEIITNVLVPKENFTSDSTYADFPYAAMIALDNVSADDVPEVVFSADDAASNNFAPVCDTVGGGIIIYAVHIPESDIVIPTIMIRIQRHAGTGEDLKDIKTAGGE